MLVRLFAVVAALVGTLAGAMYVRPETIAVVSRLLGERGVLVERGIRYGQNPRQSLDIYRPPDGVAQHAAIIVFLYGGSWSRGSKENYAFVGHALAARGFTTTIPNYRLYPEVQFPDFVADAAAAFVFVEKSLARGCAQRRPVILAGHSAGAHMAALLALDRSYIQRADPDAAAPAAFIGLAGPYTFQPTTWPSTKDAFASVAATPDLPRPITHVAPGAPPALLLHGGSDSIVALKNTRELTASLRAAGSTVETAEYPGIGHLGIVTAIAAPLRWRAPVLDAMTRFASRFGSVQPRKACAGEIGSH